MRPRVPQRPSRVLALAVLCVGLAPSTSFAVEEASGGDPTPGLPPALARALEPGAVPAEVPGLRIEVGCLTDDGWRSLDLYGDGVGFWGESTQIHLPPERLVRVLAAFREAGFAAMPDSFGRSPEGPKTPPVPEGTGQPGRMICHVRLAAGGEAKEVRQFDKGPLSEELRSLAYEILAVAREVAAEGVTVESLAGGLRAVADGRLDPRSFHLQVHRRFEGEGRPGLTGWILRLAGREAEVQRYTASGGLGPGEPHELSREDLEGVVGSLLEAEVSSLPANLWAAHYTDVRVTVLGFEEEVLARRFAGMTVATHGEAQERFTRLFNALHELVQTLEE